MRLWKYLARIVTVREREENPADESFYTYLPGGHEVEADIQPTGYSDSRAQEKQRLFGETPERALVMYCDCGANVKPGQGVCVEVGSTAPCDFRVTGVENWRGHLRAYLAFIPENRRGGA